MSWLLCCAGPASFVPTGASGPDSYRDRFLRREPPHTFNHQRAYRIWKREGLHLHRPPQRKRIHREYLARLAPDGVNEGWAMDLVSAWRVGPNQKSVRVIKIMDEGSRRALWTEAQGSISSGKLIEVLDRVVAGRGCPQYIRCDNGPEFISHQLKQWAATKGLALRFIQPGWAYAEWPDRTPE